MVTLTQGHIRFKNKYKHYRFKVKHLILLYSNGAQTNLFVHRPNKAEKVECIVSGYSPKKFIEALASKKTFFGIRQGWFFNLRYYYCHDDDRHIDPSVDLNIDLVVCRKRYAEFLRKLEE